MLETSSAERRKKHVLPTYDRTEGAACCSKKRQLCNVLFFVATIERKLLFSMLYLVLNLVLRPTLSTVFLRSNFLRIARTQRALNLLGPNPTEKNLYSHLSRAKNQPRNCCGFAGCRRE